MQYFTLILVIILVGICANDLIVRDLDESIGDASTQYRAQMFNFASQAAGAVVLDKSPSSAKGYHNLLNDDKDKYGISPCSEKKWVVIGLSEEVMITSIEMLNYEKYSSMLKDFQLLASSSYPTDEWINLGTYTALPRLGSQAFNVSTATEAHARYLKLKFLTHYSDEALCTLSQIKVFGMTAIAAFQQEVQRSDHNMRDMLSQLNSEDEPVTATASETEVQAESADTMHTVTGLEDAIIHDTNGGATDCVPEDESTCVLYESDGSASSSDRAAADRDALPVEQEVNAVGPADSLATSLSPSVAEERTGSGDKKCSSAESEEVDGVGAAGEECPRPSLPGSSGEDEVGVCNETHSANPRENTHNVRGNSSCNTTVEDSPVALPTAVDAEFVANFTSSETAHLLNGSDTQQPYNVNTSATTLSAESDMPAGPSGPGYSSFDLAGKVKRLLPGLFSSQDSRSEEEAEVVAQSGSLAYTSARATALVVGEPPAAANITEDAAMPPSGRAAIDSQVADIVEASVSVSSSLENATARGDIPTERAPAPAESPTTITVSVVNPTSPVHIHSVPAGSVQSARWAGRVPSKADGAGLTLPEPSGVTIGNRPGALGSSTAGQRAGRPITVSALKPSSSSLAPGAGVALSASALAGGPSNVTINCFETLSFFEFSRKMRAKLQQFNSANASSNSNSSSNGSTSVEEALALAQQQGVGSKDSNVFKALMQKIKALEMNAAIVEMYTTQMSECYKTVAKELLARTQTPPTLRDRYARPGDSTVTLWALVSLVWRIVLDAGEAKKAGYTRDFMQLVWVFLEDNLVSLLLFAMVCWCAVIVGIATLGIALLQVYRKDTTATGKRD